jgi:hypothetical protein
MKAYGGMEVESHTFLTSATDEDSGWLHTCLLHPQRKSPQYPFTRWLSGSESWSGHFGKPKNLFLLPGDKPRFLDYAQCTPVVVLKISCIWKRL